MNPPTLSFCVPPFSANRMYRRVQGRRGLPLSAEYRAWINEAGWTAKIQLGAGHPTIEGQFTACLELPRLCRIDLDNFHKPIFDLAERIGAIRNDAGNRNLQTTYTDRSDVLVMLWDIGGPAYKEQPKVLSFWLTNKKIKLRAGPRKVAAWRKAAGQARLV